MTKDRINKIIDECKDKESLSKLLAKLDKEFEEIPKEAVRKLSKRLNVPASEIQRLQEINRLEQEFLKGTKDEEIGVHSDLFSARSNIDGQDGGLASTLLVSGIESGSFDAAIVVTRRKGYDAEAAIAGNRNDVIAARGTKYLRVRTTPKLKELTSKGIKKIAIIGTPCEVLTARKIQQTIKRETPDAKIAIIGLFCMEAFNRDKLREEIARLLAVDIDKSDKTQIRKGVFTVKIGEKEYSCKVKELNNAVEKACHCCKDFSARLADISIGSVGAPKGYSTVVVRSKTGEELLKNMKTTKAEVERDEIARLSKFKRDRADRNLDLLNQKAGKNPE